MGRKYKNGPRESWSLPVGLEAMGRSVCIIERMELRQVRGLPPRIIRLTPSSSSMIAFTAFFFFQFLLVNQWCWSYPDLKGDCRASRLHDLLSFSDHQAHLVTTQAGADAEERNTLVFPWRKFEQHR